MKKYIPFVIAFALFIETLDATIISTAIPKIAVNLHTNPISLKVVTLNFLLGAHGNAFDIPTDIFQQVFLVVGLITVFTTLIFVFLKQEDGAEASHRKIYK
jgi:hypothetical protein